MHQRARIGAASPVVGERASLIDWLEAADCEAVPMVGLASLPAALEGRSIEALVADSSLVSEATLPGVLRTLGPNRPLILIGSPDIATGRMRHVRWLERPVTAETLMLAVALSLGEGRPVRRSPRKHIRPITASVDGITSRVLDVSIDGVRVEVSGARAAALPPHFTLRIDQFGVACTVKRVWVRQPAGKQVICGGRVVSAAPRAASAWRQLVDTTPVFGSRALLVDGQR